ncbi:sensor histidine kinase [Plantactinospora sp. B24E8]|uniref:sensor histidine kinase n=1 Tax=Plantactinospora sp. B24E8 TaxID=3153567 RepID=UPI00325E3F0F
MSAAFVVVVASSFVAAGSVIWYVRPRNRSGPLLVAVGLLWTLARLPVPDGIDRLVGGLWVAVLAHVMLAFPSGRLIGPAARAAAGLAYLSAAMTGLLQALVPASPGVAAGAGTVGAVLSGCAVIAVQAARWRRGTVTQRRLLAPVTGAALLATTLFVVVKPAMIAGAPIPYLTAVTPLAFAAIPVACLGTLLRGRMDRAGVADLVVRLGAGAGTPSIQRALAETLHDPTLRVTYRVPGVDRYVDLDGHDLPPDAGAAVTRIDRNGEPLALLVHDRTLLDNPELVDAACAAVALALENERLTADLRARLREVAESRNRVLRAAEDERRRLERDLHDGVQQRLLSIPLVLGLADAALDERPERTRALITEARGTAFAVLGELRAIGQGIHPPVLTERGLEGAVRELMALTPVPVSLRVRLAAPPPASVETTAYYVVAEALANVTKHADAGRAEVRIDADTGRLTVEVVDDGRGGADTAAGTGLRGIAERARNNGGRLTLTSPPGGGTRVEAVLPCES